jgi:osmotically-inducible protein OsmY
MRIILTTFIMISVAGCVQSVEKPTADLPHGGSEAEGPSGRHRASDPAAPFDQPESPTDDDITLDIRGKMMKTEMSANLQNVRVTTQDGGVKLRGLVKTEEEKQKVEEIARETVGAKWIDNQIEVE